MRTGKIVHFDAKWDGSGKLESGPDQELSDKAEAAFKALDMWSDDEDDGNRVFIGLKPDTFPYGNFQEFINLLFQNEMPQEITEMIVRTHESGFDYITFF